MTPAFVPEEFFAFRKAARRRCGDAWELGGEGLSLAGAPHGRVADRAVRASPGRWVCLVERWGCAPTRMGGACTTLYALSWLSVLVGLGEGTGVFEEFHQGGHPSTHAARPTSQVKL